MNGARFLDPTVLARIDNLELVARTVVDGFISGLHHSPYLGLSTDFAEHRQYMPGDDIRRIDWRVFGRTDRFYVKEFEADTNANMLVLLDVSRSMDFGEPVGKLDYGRMLAACLLYLSRRQRDRVGLVTFDGALLDYVPASAKHLELALHTLQGRQAGGQGDLAGPLRKAAEILRRRSILVLVSDCYDEPDVTVRALAALRDRGHDVIVFHILDSAELTFPFEDASPFEDLETGERAPVVPATMREEYRTLIRGHCDTLARRLGDNRVDYYLADTGKPLDFALLEYLTRREWLARVK
ncbi:MAG: DUF58 domain-containing protein [Gemmatimonadota bacterium]|nr:DUF58 domain-containing protein [Gemmatimonadota bacterium]MDH4350218.1 DUF58 domain-containing protein [Gemmatimonadota bacterium]